MMEELKISMEYNGFKQALDREFQKAAEGFVRIGYLLKVARDTDVLEKSGYKNVSEFAQKEYGLTKDIVSRYIAINDRYSDGGYSDKLKFRFQGYGYAKLAEMLTLSDEVIEAIPLEATRAAIQEVKREIKEEEKITDLEVIMEGEDADQAGLENNLVKALHQYGYENREKYVQIWQVVNDYSIDLDTGIEKILDIMAPTGFAMITVRIQGIGRIMISIRGKDNAIEVINLRNNEKGNYIWPEFIETLKGLCSNGKNAKKTWEELYGEPFREEKPEEKPKVAPVQPQSSVSLENKHEVELPQAEVKTEDPENSGKAPAQLKSEIDQESDPEPVEIQDHKETVDPPDPDPEDDITEDQTEGQWQQGQQEPEENQQEDQEDVGSAEVKQMDIENYPEYLPEGYIKCHDGSEVQETETYKQWKYIQSFISDLHKQITSREEPDLDTCRKLISGASCLKMFMEDLISMKEEQEDE